MERPGPAGSFPFSGLASLLPFAALWLLACSGLAIHWRLNPQYQYGWFVPALALYAGWNRWRTRPAPGQPSALGRWVVAAGALMVFPSWVFCQPNLDWPVVNWLFTAEIAAITLGAVSAVGGKPWLRHFFFCAALIFTAVPWPDQLESPLIQGMMRLVSLSAVNLLDLLGVGALQHGNLIEVATGSVGVSEACSGIRSFQGSLMASLFLGELFRFGLSRRLLLVVVSLLVAFLSNVLRASFLAWNAAQSGVEAVERWHDPAGMTILMACIAAIYALAWFLDQGSLPQVALARVPPAHPLPKGFILGLSVWIALAVVATELWYHDTAKPPESPWQMQPPAGSTPVQIPVVAIANLHYDEATTASWLDAEGHRCLLYFFQWRFGPAFSRVAAALHHPDVCLPASGSALKEDRGIQTETVAGFSLPFHAYSFQQGDGLLFVYHGIWQIRTERGQRHGPLSTAKHVAAVQSVLWRERSVGQQSAEIMISDCADAEQADAAFRAMLPELIVPAPTTASQ